MSDIVKVIFDGDLDPLTAKTAVAKGELDAFVAESQAEIKGIGAVGDAIGASAAKGSQEFSRYYKPVINDLSKDLNALGQGFEKVLGAEASREARAGIEGLSYELKKLNAEGYATDASSLIFEERLRTLQKELAEYQFQLAAAAQENIFFAETEVIAAEAGKVGNLGSRPLQGYGGLFRATGLTGAGVNEVEANAALQIIGKLGIAVSSLVVVGGVAAIGASAVLISSKIKEEAEKRLETEEKVASAVNRQILSLKQAFVEEDRLKQLELDRERITAKISDNVNSSDRAGLEDLRTKTEKDKDDRIVELNRLEAALKAEEAVLAGDKERKPAGGLSASLFGGATAADIRGAVGADQANIDKTKNDIKTTQSILEADRATLEEIKKGHTEITANLNKAFDSNFTRNVKDQEADAKLREKQTEELRKSIKEANNEIDTLTKGYKTEFEALYAGADKENPFVRQMVANAKAVETLEEKLKGASPELRNTAKALLDAANAQQSYTVQITNAFAGVDLQAQAERFRNPTQRELQNRFNAQLGDFQRESNSTNPDVFYDFQQSQKQIDETAQRNLQEKIDKKLDIAAGAKTDDQKAIADKAVTAFAAGLNPDELTASERGRIADAFERSQVRNEARQEEALTIFKKLNATWEDIRKNGLRLSNIAEAGGKQALDITLTDDTSDKKVANATSATPQDVSLGYASGPGGLTNL